MAIKVQSDGRATKKKKVIGALVPLAYPNADAIRALNALQALQFNNGRKPDSVKLIRTLRS